MIRDVDGHDVEAVERGDRAARSGSPTGRSLICCKTIIGKGAPNKAGTARAHGAALGDDEVAATRAALGWPHPPFEIPDDDLRARGTRASAARSAEAAWNARFARYRDAASRARRRVRAPHGTASCPRIGRDARASLVAAQRGKAETIATRKASQNALEALAPRAAGADRRLGRPHRLEPHELVKARKRGRRATTRRQLHHYGVREFGMAAIMNGIALHGGFIPYGGTFLDVLRLRAQRACAWRR